MDQFIMNSDGIRAIATNLVFDLDGRIIINEEAPTMIDDILSMLSDASKREGVYIQLSLIKFIPKVMVPMLTNLEDQDIDADLTFYGLVKLLGNITQPVEFLMKQKHQLDSYGQGLMTQMAATRVCLLKEAAIAEVLLTRLKAFIPKHGEAATDEQKEVLVLGLYLIRNLLYTADLDFTPQECEAVQQNALLTMFQSGLKEFLMEIMKSDQLHVWCVPLVQLFSLIYGEETGNKVLDVGDSASQFFTEENGSDERGTCVNGTCSDDTIRNTVAMDDLESTVATECEASSSPTLELAESERGSTPPSASPAQCKHMETFVGYIKQSIEMDLKSLTLKEFINDFTNAFVAEGFSKLIIAVREYYLYGTQTDLSDLYFLWIFSFFLNHALTRGAPLNCLQPCFTTDVIGLIVYIGVQSCEQAIYAKKNKDQTGAANNSARMQLVMKALMTAFQAISTVIENKPCTPEAERMNKLKNALAESSDMRNLFVLLLCHFEQSSEDRALLADIVSANHKYLVLVESVMSEDGTKPFCMVDHVKNFATEDMMSLYGWLLEDYASNSAALNDHIFTMMYHVAGDCAAPEALLNFSVIKTFIEVWDDNVPFSTDVHDLINYILQYFMTVGSENLEGCAQMLLGRALKNKQKAPSPEESGLSREEEDILFSVMCEDDGSDLSAAAAGVKALKENGFIRKELQVAIQLNQMSHWSDAMLDSFLKQHCPDTRPPSQPAAAPRLDSVDACISKLREAGKQDWLSWLQTELLDIWFIKIGGRGFKSCQKPERLTMYICYQSIHESDVPLVAYTKSQQAALEDPTFVDLLRCMGCRHPEQYNAVFPRIPLWPVEKLHTLAQNLGAVDCFDSLDFTKADIKSAMTTTELPEENAVNKAQPVKQHGPDSSLWDQMVHQSNLMKRQHVTSQDASGNKVSKREHSSAESN